LKKAGGLNDTNKLAGDTAPRSYIINGWNDYFDATLSKEDFAKYMSANIIFRSMNKQSGCLPRPFYSGRRAASPPIITWISWRP
jgi:hypothetical protein